MITKQEKCYNVIENMVRLENQSDYCKHIF